MMRYSVHPGDQILVKGYGFLSFAKNTSKRIGKNISKTLSSKYTQKLNGHTKQSGQKFFCQTVKKLILNNHSKNCNWSRR